MEISYSSLAFQSYSSLAAQSYNSLAVQSYNSLAVHSYSILAAQSYSILAAQSYSSLAAQSYNSLAVPPGQMVKVHKFCLCVLKLLSFPKWQSDYLLKLSKVTVCSSFPKWLSAQGDPCKELSILKKKYIRRSFLEPHMIKVHKFCLCVLKLISFLLKFSKMLKFSKVTICSGLPKWLSAQVFQSDYQLKISKMTFGSSSNLGLVPKWPPKATPSTQGSYSGSLHRI